MNIQSIKPGLLPQWRDILIIISVVVPVSILLIVLGLEFGASGVFVGFLLGYGTAGVLWTLHYLQARKS
jgi:hypothetical protein